MKIKVNKKVIEIKNPKLCNGFERFLGLMFTRRKKAKALLFDFKKPTKITIHSCFVFFPFIALWLDDKDKVIDLRIVKPFNLYVSPKKSFHKLIEIPINKEYSRIIKLLCSQSHSLQF